MWSNTMIKIVTNEIGFDSENCYLKTDSVATFSSNKLLYLIDMRQWQTRHPKMNEIAADKNDSLR